MGELKQHNMKTLLLLSILGLALVSADLKTEDQHTEEADVVAVDDSAEAMDDLDGEDSRRSRGGSSCTTYRAVLGPNEPLANGFTGDFTMKLCDGRAAKYKTNIKGDFDGETELKYHLHSDYNTEESRALLVDLARAATTTQPSSAVALPPTKAPAPRIWNSAQQTSSTCAQLTLRTANSGTSAARTA